MNIVLELTKREQEIFDEVMERVGETAAFLAGISHAERLNWLKEHQYSHPISFEREIGGTKLKAALWTWTGNRRNQNAILPDAVRCLHHGIIVFHLEGMILKWMQLCQWQLNNLFAALVGAALIRGRFAFRHSQSPPDFGHKK